MNIFLLAAKNSIFVKTYSHFRMWITSGILIFSLEEKKKDPRTEAACVIREAFGLAWLLNVDVYR